MIKAVFCIKRKTFYSNIFFVYNVYFETLTKHHIAVLILVKYKADRFEAGERRQ